jgi:metallophosphoesterase superfamily enzyme
MDGFFALPPPFEGFFASPHRFLWHAATRTAVLSDLHLGAEASLARQGLYLPDTSSAAIRRAWHEIASLSPARVVLAGDVFDAREPDGRAVGLFGDLVAAVASARISFLPGNHDPGVELLARMTRDLPITVEPVTEVAGIRVTHGHEVPELPAGGLVTGHQHPAVILATRVRSAKMICYALCVVRRGGGPRVPVVVLPAFSPLPLGSNLLTGRNWILDLPAPAAAEVRVLGIVERRVLDFGPLAGLAGGA